jgi:Domain of unknown function DUF29
MGTLTRTLYETDFVEWADRTAQLLRQYSEERLHEIYQQAVKDAIAVTGLKAKASELGLPETCPYTISGLLERDLDALRDMLA